VFSKKRAFFGGGWVFSNSSSRRRSRLLRLHRVLLALQLNRSCEMHMLRLGRSVHVYILSHHLVELAVVSGSPIHSSFIPPYVASIIRAATAHHAVYATNPRCTIVIEMREKKREREEIITREQTITQCTIRQFLTLYFF